jgi:hypothetical protein
LLKSAPLEPHRSPDLTPLDFFNVINAVFRNPIDNLLELQRAIEDATSSVEPEMFLLIEEFDVVCSKVDIIPNIFANHLLFMFVKIFSFLFFQLI